MTQRAPRTTSEHKCAGKRQYASERIANVRAGQLTAAHGVALYVYRCRHCNRWHHTRQKPGLGFKPLHLVDRTPALVALDDFEVLS